MLNELHGDSTRPEDVLVLRFVQKRLKESEVEEERKFDLEHPKINKQDFFSHNKIETG